VVPPYTLGEQQQAARLVRLEALQGFGAALELVESFDVLVGVGVGRGRVVVLGRDAVAFALHAECERFVLDDGLEPGDEVVGAGGGRR
jgi:hypothetical protein